MILIDADIVAYRIGWALNDDTYERACVATDTFILDILCAVGVDVPQYQLFLTGNTASNFRHKVAFTLPYKGNRHNTPKPVHFKPIRDYLVSKWDAVVIEGEEADDAIARANHLEPDAIMVSVDKDFLQCPGKMYDPVKRVMHHTSELDGLRFLYKQIVMGDMTDNIRGINGVGEKTAEKAMGHLTTEEEMYQAAYDLYKGDEVALLETARLVYLRRIPNEWWQKPEDRNYDRSDTGNYTGSSAPIDSTQQSHDSAWQSTVPPSSGVDRRTTRRGKGNRPANSRRCG